MDKIKKEFEELAERSMKYNYDNPYPKYKTANNSNPHERVVSLQPKGVDVCQEIFNNGVQTFYGKIDVIMKETMKDNGFEFIDIEDLKQNAKVDVYADGTSIFSYKGKPLLEFTKIEIVFEGNKATLTQKYRRLSN